MKKLIAILTILCLLCAACTALADLIPPKFEDMPAAIIEDEDTIVEETAFEGEWVLNVAFAGTEYVDEQTLFDTYDYNFMPYLIKNGMITQDIQQENGEFVTVEMPYTFEAGQLQGKDGNGRDFAIDLLADGNIALALFYPGEGDEVLCLTVFLVHPEE